VFVIAGHVRSLRRELKVATLLGRGSVVSHRAAAWLLRFEGFARSGPIPVEVSVRAPRSLLVPAGLAITVHRPTPLGPSDVVDVDGIPCTSKPRTLADLGSVVTAEAVLLSLIACHRDGLSLPAVRRVALALHRPGQAGTKTVLQHLDALARAGTVPESWLEELLRRILARPDFPPLVSQFVLRDGRGRTIARFDHAFPEARLAIEGHSRQFHFGPLHESLDEDRDLRVARCGWEILYLGCYADRRPAEVVQAVGDVLAHRLPPPAP